MQCVILAGGLGTRIRSRSGDLPKALLRAEEGLKYRSVTVWGYKDGADAEVLDSESRCPVVLEEEFRIEGIRCYCILGVNSHERVEKQAVIISLGFEGPGQLAWGSTVVDTYVALTRAVAEVCIILAPFVMLVYSYHLTLVL